MMNRVFSDTQFVKKLQKIFIKDKPIALPWGEWDEWNASEKERNPLGYFIAETFPEKVDDVYEFCFGWFFSLRRYIYNVRQNSHYIDPKLKKGKYYENDVLLEETVFEFLVDFVEKEAAFCHMAYNEEGFKVIKRRCPAAGIEWMKEQNNKDFDKLLEIYQWRKDNNKNDIYEKSEYYQYTRELEKKYNCSSLDVMFGKTNISAEELKKFNMLKKKQESEQKKYDALKEKYMLDVVKLRKIMWT